MIIIIINYRSEQRYMGKLYESIGRKAMSSNVLESVKPPMIVRLQDNTLIVQPFIK